MAPSRKKKMLELAGSGDDGSTGLLGGGRASKDDVRIEAFGTVDEASSALGLAKALTVHPQVRAICEELQRGLYSVGAELGTNPAAEASFVTTTEAEVNRLDELITELESEVTMPEGFILPGATPASGALDLARAIVRRAERRCVSLEKARGLANPQVRRWLNRLSLLLFVAGRYEEGLSGSPAKAAKTDRARSG
ncbi:MAG TPA: cob(I)yrinic acid a,c-diamide adenosyltransferase [Candidatus Dormibacteraeota bacterium]|nr:cob(I)yrinic acid a,c-diamide adenosyltransferase [Candidatus Dormibacteraeota bacterium]